jgi:hypothetical protein
VARGKEREPDRLLGAVVAAQRCVARPGLAQ